MARWLTTLRTTHSIVFELPVLFLKPNKLRGTVKLAIVHGTDICYNYSNIIWLMIFFLFTLLVFFVIFFIPHFNFIFHLLCYYFIVLSLIVLASLLTFISNFDFRDLLRAKERKSNNCCFRSVEPFTTKKCSTLYRILSASSIFYLKDKR